MRDDVVIVGIKYRGAVDETWKDRANCAPGAPGHLPVDAFFPEYKANLDQRVRAVCAGCEVRSECLEFAGADRAGFWGGMSEKERRAWRRRRRAKAG